MALIKCEECGKEISDTVRKCPNCGYKAKKKNNRKIIIIISLIIIIIIAGIFIASIMVSNHNKKVAEEKELAYNQLMVKVGGKTYVYGMVSELVCYDIGQIWYNSIFEKNDSKYNEYTKEKQEYDGYSFSTNNDASTSISNYQKAKEKPLSDLKSKKDEVGEEIKKLKDMPNEEYKDAYDEIVSFYGIFSKLVDAATSPSGTYSDYIKTYNNYANEFKESYNRLKILIPEVERYKENNNEIIEKESNE